MSLRKRTHELAASTPTLREPLMGILRKATSWTGGTFMTAPAKGYETKEVKASMYGPWAVHKSLRGGGWSVSFAPLGLLVYSGFGKMASARKFVELLLEQSPGLLSAKTKSDVMRDIKYDQMKALAEQVQRPERAEKRKKTLRTRLQRSRDPKVSALLKRFESKIQKGDLDKIQKGMEALGYEAQYSHFEPASYNAIWEHPMVVDSNEGAGDLGHWFYTMYQSKKQADYQPDFALTYGRIGNTANWTFKKRD